MKPRTSGSSSMTRIDSAGAWRLRAAGRLPARRLPSRLRPRPCGRELDRGAFAGPALDARGAARLARHSIDHRQAEPGSLADFLGGEEGLERALDDFGRHAGSGVADGELDIVAVLELGVARHFDLRSSRSQDSPVGHGVARVDREVEDRDLELGRIGHDRDQQIVEVELLGDPRAEHVLEQRAHVLDHGTTHVGCTSSRWTRLKASSCAVSRAPRSAPPAHSRHSA